MLFAALLACVGVVKAQPEEGKMYRLKENTQGLYLTIDNTQYNRENENGTAGSVPLLAKSVANDDQIWYFEATEKENKYNMVSKSGYYLYHASWNVLAYNTEKTKAIVKIVTNGDGTFKIMNGNTGNQWYKSQNVDGTWYPFCDAGEGAAVTWALEEVSESEFEASEEYTALLNLITVAETLAETVKANIGTAIGEYTQATATALNNAIATAKALNGNEVAQSHIDALQDAINSVSYILPTIGKYYQFHSSLVAFAETKAVYSNGSAPAWKTLDEADKSFYWLAVAYDGGVVLQNVADSKYMVGNADKSGAWSMTAAVAAESKVSVKIFNKENAKGYEYGVILNNWQMHCNGHSNGNGTASNIVSWNTDNPNSASSWYIKEVELPQFYTVTYNFQYNGVTKFTQTAELASGAAYPAISVAFPYGVTATRPEGVVSQSETIVVPLNVEHELPFKAAESVEDITTWYYVQMHANPAVTAYIEDNGGDNIAWNNKVVADEDIDSHLWGYVGDVWTGIKVVNMSGRAIVSNSGDAVLGDAENATAFIPSTSQAGGDWFCLKYPTGNYLNAQGNQGEGTGKVASYFDNDNGSSFFVTEYGKEYTVEVSSVGYSTYYSQYKLAIPETVKAYVVAEANDGSAVLEQVKGILPARTGVILEGEGSYVFKTSAAKPATIVSNLLKGSAVAEEVTVAENKIAYILGKGNNGVGLYKVKLNDDKFTNGANKAYMVLDKPAGGDAAPAMFSFGRGEGTTAIHNSQFTIDNVVIYDLTGRRVETMEKGIYIVNGKKVIR